ncbi:MAG: hypothetical protein MHMPM18_002969, partial [Marteilia pararefringens]
MEMARFSLTTCGSRYARGERSDRCHKVDRSNSEFERSKMLIYFKEPSLKLKQSQTQTQLYRKSRLFKRCGLGLDRQIPSETLSSVFNGTSFANRKHTGSIARRDISRPEGRCGERCAQIRERRRGLRS